MDNVLQPCGTVKIDGVELTLCTEGQQTRDADGIVRRGIFHAFDSQGNEVTDQYTQETLFHASRLGNIGSETESSSESSVGGNNVNSAGGATSGVNATGTNTGTSQTQPAGTSASISNPSVAAAAARAAASNAATTINAGAGQPQNAQPALPGEGSSSTPPVPPVPPVPPNNNAAQNASPFDNNNNSGNGGNNGGNPTGGVGGGDTGDSPAARLVAALNRSNKSQDDLKAVLQKLVEANEKNKAEKEEKESKAASEKLSRSIIGLITGAMARQTFTTAWNIGRDPTKDNFERDTTRDTIGGVLGGAGAGAATGFTLGGPWGAVAGGVVGAGVGAWNAWQGKHNERFGQERNDLVRLEWNQRDSMYNQNYNLGDSFMRMSMRWMSAEDRQKTLMARVNWLRHGTIDETESGYINNGEGYAPIEPEKPDTKKAKPVGQEVKPQVEGFTQADADDAKDRMSDAAKKAAEVLSGAVEEGASTSKEEVKRKVAESGEKVAAIAKNASEEADKQADKVKSVTQTNKPQITRPYTFENKDERFKNARRVGTGNIRSFANQDERFKDAKRLTAPKKINRTKKTDTSSVGRGIVGFSVPVKTKTKYFGNKANDPNRKPPSMTTHVFGNAPGYGGANAVQHKDDSLSDTGAFLYKTQYAKNNKALIEAQKRGSTTPKYGAPRKTKETYFGDEKARPDRLKPKSLNQRATELLTYADKFQKDQQEREQKRAREAYEQRNSKSLNAHTTSIQSGTGAWEEFVDGQRKRVGAQAKATADAGTTLPASTWAKPKPKPKAIKYTRQTKYSNLTMDEVKDMQTNRYGESKYKRQDRTIEGFDKKAQQGYIGIEHRDEFLKGTAGNQDERRKRIEARTNADRERANALEGEAMTTMWQARLDTLQMPNTRNLVDAYQAKGMSMGKSIDAGGVQDNIYGEMQRVREILMNIQRKFEKKGDDYSIKASTVNINVDRLSA